MPHVCAQLCVHIFVCEITKQLFLLKKKKNAKAMTYAHKQTYTHILPTRYTQFKAQFAPGSGLETARTY